MAPARHWLPLVWGITWVVVAACKAPIPTERLADAGGICGDFKIDPNEVCDDGNTISGDGCSADCQSDETCGNGIIDVGELCDDGNTIGCDGCSADCKSDETCGNGITDVCKGETCDDGNTMGGDGCSANCQSNEMCGNCQTDASLNEQCDACGIQTKTCEVNCKFQKCGDHIVNALAGEECDDGNNTSGDGCDDKCRKEICGNSRVEDNEQCDNGNNSFNGPCPHCRNAVCGDNHVFNGVEQCDEGASPSPHGACPAQCKRAFCGDGFVWNVEGGHEDCDDGTNATDGACPNCNTASCGDGFVEQGVEECDEGSTPGANGACPPDGMGNPTCVSAICGDGLIWDTEGGTEQCDNGASNGNDGICDSSCQCVNGAPC